MKKRKKNPTNPLSILMVDVDNFKEINNQYGHPIGDRALKEISDIVKNCSRDYDVCARYGGDEFVLLLPGATSNDAVDVCNRIFNKMKELHLTNNSHKELEVSLSIGIAEWHSHMSPQDLMTKADSMLLISKVEGKGKYTM